MSDTDMEADESSLFSGEMPSIMPSIRKGKAALKESQESGRIATATKELPPPQGIGMADAFDWGLTAQILLTPILAKMLGQSIPAKIPGDHPILIKALLFI